MGEVTQEQAVVVDQHAGQSQVCQSGWAAFDQARAVAPGQQRREWSQHSSSTSPSATSWLFRRGPPSANTTCAPN